MIIYLVSHFDDNVDQSLKEIGVVNRLLSYLYIKVEAEKAGLKYYINKKEGKEEKEEKDESKTI